MPDTQGAKFSAIQQSQSIELVGLGWEKSDPTRVLQSFVREHFRIHYVTRGAGWLETKEQAYRLTEGAGFVIFPGVASQYYPDQENPWEYFWLGAKGDGLDALVRGASLTRNAPVYQITNTIDEARANFVDIYASLIHASSREQSTAYYICKLFYNLTAISEAKRSQSYAFESCLRYIHQNYMHEISISALASLFAIDRTYLYKLFKKNIDCSPQSYLIQHRVSKACDSLLATEKGIAEIAYSVGFNDLSDFSKQFKKSTGMTAKEFRAVSAQKNNVSTGIYF